MQQTKKLYDDNPYQTSFDASVLSCEPYTAPEKKAEQGTPLYDVIFDQTIFFPEEGGQNADTGTIGSHPVLDVQIKDGVIHHIMNMPFEIGRASCRERV